MCLSKLDVLQRATRIILDCGCPWRPLLRVADRLHSRRRSSSQLCGTEMLEVFHRHQKQNIISLSQCQPSSTSSPLHLCTQTTGKNGTLDRPFVSCIVLSSFQHASCPCFNPLHVSCPLRRRLTMHAVWYMLDDVLTRVWRKGDISKPHHCCIYNYQSAPCCGDSAMCVTYFQSCMLPLTCSGKTVEEVWNSIHKSNGNSNGEQQPGLPTFQTVTLGSFLERVGVDFPSMDLQQNGLLPPAPELQVWSLELHSGRLTYAGFNLTHLLRMENGSNAHRQMLILSGDVSYMHNIPAVFTRLCRHLQAMG